jgi:TusA-related sulfurtransferase
MTNDSAMIDAINMAIKSQEEIRVQLLEEVQKLESAIGHKNQSGSIKFYKISLDRVLKEKEGLESQITQLRNGELQQANQKLQRAQQKSDAIRERIEEMKKIRSGGILEKINDESTSLDTVKELIESLNKEIQTFDKQEQEYTKKISDSRTRLHTLQEINFQRQRKAAINDWNDELNDERKLNTKDSVPPLSSPVHQVSQAKAGSNRKRSSTLCQRRAPPPPPTIL